MKSTKWICAIILAIAVAAFGIASLGAESTPTLSVETEKTEDGVLVKLVADADINLGGFQLSVDCGDAFEYVAKSASSPLGTVNEGVDGFVAESGYGANVAAGDPLLELTYTTTSSFEEGQTYTFTFNIVEIFLGDADQSLLAEETSVSGTYGEEAQTTTAEQTTVEDQTTVEQTTAEQTTAEQTTAEQTTVEQTTVEQTTVEQTTVEDQTTVEQTTAEQTTTEPASATDETQPASETETEAATGTDAEGNDTGDSSTIRLFALTGLVAAAALALVYGLKKKATE